MKFVIIKTTVGDRDSYQRNLKEHLRYLESLRKRTVLKNAGTFDDRSGGMLLVEAEGLEEAIAIARKDPLVVAGVDRYHVHGWHPTVDVAKGLVAVTTPAIKPVDSTPIKAPPPEEDNFKVVDIKQHPRREEIMARCLAPDEIPEDDPIRMGYLRLAWPRGLNKVLLLHDEQIAGQIEYAPPESSGLPVTGDGVTVVHCIWVLDAFTGLEGARRLLSACAVASMAQSLVTVAYNHTLPWMPAGFFESHGFVTLDQVETGRFFGDTPIVAYLMWRPVCPGAPRPTWDRDKVLDGVDFCPAYPWLFGKRIYWGDKYPIKGVIVREGLRRPAVLEQMPVLGTYEAKNWTVVQIGVPEADINRAVELIQASLIDEPTYFAHLYNDDRVIIVFPDKVFEATPAPESWKEAVKYGVDKGVPKDELDFAPFKAHRDATTQE